MQIRNFMEDLVWQRLDEVLTRHPKACGCEKCRYDIAALAPKLLPPRYVVTDQGETYTRIKGLEQQFNVDIITALSHAIQIVCQQPHHDEG